MSATKTQAFVLKTQDYRDTSLLATFYTREYGKIRGIVKGIRDTRVRFGSTLEPFSLNEILFYKRRRGGDLHQVTQVELLDLYPSVREDLERLSYASYFCELLDELVEAEEPGPALFDLFRDSLNFLASGASAKRAARIFEVKFFSLLGLMPEINACVSCRSADIERAYFNSSMGGVHCEKCHKGTHGRGVSPARVGGTSVPISKGALNFLRHVMRSQVADLGKVKVSQGVGEELERILRRFTDFHLSNKLKTVQFMEKMEF